MSRKTKLAFLNRISFTAITTGEYQALDELHIADWVNRLAGVKAEFETKTGKRKSIKEVYFSSKT